ncbi:unnamed protein product [marine sediment metagenome]|uniref:Uncharacterized protein n=1 Tax=marine sediment metagenome TaxID=412755 RepID=X1LPF3_9ZZZZ
MWQGVSKLFKSGLSRLKATKKLALAASANGNNSIYLRFLALAILIPYFLFTSGFLFEVTGSELYGVYEAPSSWALSSYRLDMPVFNQKEVDAAFYLVERIDNEMPVYGDEHGRLLLLEHFHGQVQSIPASGEVPQDAYIFLRTWNIEKGEIMTTERRIQGWRLKHVDLATVPEMLNGHEIIYNNRGAQILAPRQ